ncbi:COP9 signalosome complex subunit 3 [Trichinella sp. T8]|nr:COP9 signalosome complex subunit 3 [Trichinella sp. T8]
MCPTVKYYHFLARIVVSKLIKQVISVKMADGFQRNSNPILDAINSYTSNHDYQALTTFLRTCANGTLLTSSPNVTTFYQQNLPQFSIAALGVLYARTQCLGTLDPSDAQSEIKNIISCFKEIVEVIEQRQLEIALDLYLTVCHRVAKHLVSGNECGLGIDMLVKAIRRLQQSPNCWTSIHADLCMICLRAKNVNPAVPFLIAPIKYLLPESYQGRVSAKHFVLYYYYGGMILSVIKDMERAHFFFEMVLTVPTKCLLPMFIDSYEKYLLINLILFGESVSLPKYTCASFFIAFPFFSVLPYDELAKACSACNFELVENVIMKYENTFKADCNLGLAKQVLNSMRKRKAQQLSKIYRTLKVCDFGKMCYIHQDKDVIKFIMDMVQAGELKAQIDEVNGLVTLSEGSFSPESTKCAKNMKLLSEMFDQILQISDDIAKNSSNLLPVSAAHTYMEDEGVCNMIATSSKDMADDRDIAL